MEHTLSDHQSFGMSPKNPAFLRLTRRNKRSDSGIPADSGNPAGRQSAAFRADWPTLWKNSALFTYEALRVLFTVFLLSHDSENHRKLTFSKHLTRNNMTPAIPEGLCRGLSYSTFIYISQVTMYVYHAIAIDKAQI